LKLTIRIIRDQKEDRTAEHRTPNFEGMYPDISVHRMFGFKKQSPVNYFILRYWVFDIRYFITRTQYADIQVIEFYGI